VRKSVRRLWCRCNTTSPQQGYLEPRAVQPIGQQDLVFEQLVPNRTQERQLAGSLARIGGHGGVQDRAGHQTEEHDQADRGKSQARLLVVRLGILGLIRLGVGHLDDGAVGDFHATALPSPCVRRCVVELGARGSDETVKVFFRQSDSRLAIGAGFRRTRRPAMQRQPNQEPRHRLATGVVGVENLAEKHPQRHQRRVDGLRRLGGRTGHLLEHLGRQEIGERQPLALPKRLPHRTDLPRNGIPCTITHLGLLAGFQGSCDANKTPL
jgi:hypothetical protein